ncbi:hypothetical protein ACFL6I_16195 [candidate division KSB1 bacterium]
MNKKTCLLLSAFLIALLMLPSAFAEDNETDFELDILGDKLFDEWVTEGESFKVSGLEVFVSAANGGEGLFLFPQKTIMLRENQCEMIDRLRVCMDDWEYVIGGSVKIHGTDKQKFHLVISVPAPDINIDRSAEDTSIEIGESTRITVIIKNEGSQPALGLSYVETIPPEFQATMVSGLIQQGNELTWHGSIPSYGEKKFSYTIKANSGFSGKIYSVLNYEIHNIPKMIEDSIGIGVSSLISIGQELEKKSIQYREEERVYITIKNKRSLEMDTELTVSFPEELYVVATHFNDTYGDSYKWEGTLEEDEELTFITRIRGDDVGKHKINITLKGSFTDKKRVDEKKYIDVDVTVNNAELYFIPKKIKKGEESRIKLYLKNTNTFAEMTDIDLFVESDYFNGTGHLNDYGPVEYNEVLAFKITPEETGEINAKAQVVYYVGTKKFVVNKEEKIEIEDDEPEPEPEPETNETQPEDNATETPEEEPEESPEEDKKSWTEKEFSAVSYVKSSMNKIRDSLDLIFGLKKEIKELREPADKVNETDQG